MSAGLRSPASGEALRRDTPHSLAANGERWPVVDGIPFLRVGREELAAAALRDLDRGEPGAALVRLLADQDEWWDGPPPDPADLAWLVAGRERLSLREAMRLLGYGRVGDYFAHRWTDPTFLAGLALIEAHWAGPRTAFELACGIGHYLRELALRGLSVGGGDVVFSKLWLARHWVVGEEADLVCFDAAHPWPVQDRRADLVLCHDALYFLEPKAEIVARLRAIAGEAGQLAVGHVHNRDAANLSAGAGMTAAEIEGLFPDAAVYDDDELTRAAASARAPRPAAPDSLKHAEAFSLASGPHGLPQPVAGLLILPREGARLRRNPLFRADPDGRSARLAWPSERYRAEYAPRATFPDETEVSAEADYGAALADRVRRRELVALPSRW